MLLAVVATMAAAQDDSTVIYERSYFDQFNPVSLEDMIQYIPGGATMLSGRGSGGGGNNNRGFGSNDSQILINGRRMSGKVNDMSTTLARIRADQVERIELIRGNAEGLDIRNEGILFNVILEEGATSSSSSFVDVSLNHVDGMDPTPGVLASYNASNGPLDYVISYEREVRPRVELTDEQIFNADRTPREFRRQSQRNERINNIITGNLGYEFADGTLLRLNGLLSDSESSRLRHEDQFLGREGEAAAPYAIEAAQFLDDRKEYEIGGDLEFDVGNIGRLKTMFVFNRKQNTDEIFQDSIVDDVTNRFFTSFADFDEGETIVRSAMTSVIGSHTIEYGAEGAFNTLDRTFAFNNDPLENAIVEEDRYEFFITHSIQLSDQISLQSALTQEISTIFQNRDGQKNERDFDFLKPRVELRYDLTPSDQVRLLAERTVSQLNLNDFVASRNVEDDTINFGNPDLRPESTWAYSVGYEHRFANDGGAIEVKLTHEDISHHIDKILIGTDDSGTGNIGDASKMMLDTNISTRFGFIGFPAAVMTFTYRYEESDTIDPFTGLERLTRFSTPYYFNIDFRHDVENTNWSYGFDAHRRSARIRQDVSLYEFTDFEIHVNSAWVEYNFNPNLKVRFEGSHFGNEDGRTFDKYFYDGHIADGVVRRIDFQDWRVDADFTLSVQATF